MSDNPKEAEKEMEKAIFISADCWLKVFDLLPPFQLGFGIAMVSRRFDCFVDEHFKTRKWKLGDMIIEGKIGKNGAKEMKIVQIGNLGGKELPIPQVPLPNKVIGFGRISIAFIDQNVLAFLRHFDRFFASCTTEFDIYVENVSISEFVLRNIWPMFNDTILLIQAEGIFFRPMRQLGPSTLNDYPSLRILSTGILPEFPPDDTANASDGQVVTKWLFSPRPDNLPKVFTCIVEAPEVASMEQWLATVEQFKTAFSIASSPVNFGFSVFFPPSDEPLTVEPFELTNELTGEKLTVIEEDEDAFVVIRCPIANDVSKWRKATYAGVNDRQNQIDFMIRDDGFDKSLLDAASAGPSGDH